MSTTRVVLINGKSTRAQAIVRWLSELSALQVESLEHDFERSWFRPQPGDIVIFEVTSLEKFQNFVKTARHYHSANQGFATVVVASQIAFKIDDAIKEFPETFVVEGDLRKLDMSSSIMRVIQKAHLFRNTTEDDASRSPFQPILTIGEKVKILRDALHSKAQVTLSPANSKTILKGHLSELEAGTGDFLFKMPDDSLKGFDASLSQSKVAITMSLKQARVFFWARKMTIRDASTVSVEAPVDLFVVQRRGDFRWQVEPQTFDLKVHDVLYKPTLLDVSMNGMAIVVPRALHEELKRLKGLVNVEFQLDGCRVKVAELAMRHSAPIPGGSDYRVGFQFTKISPSSSRLLSDFLEARSRDYFQNYLVAKSS
jgi:c-di-GMP-binding flagellar brake protein YcgR